MPDTHDLRTPEDGLQSAGSPPAGLPPAGLPPALAERLRALPAPDPGDAYRSTLAARVDARRLAASSADAAPRRVDRAAQPRARRASGAWASVAAACVAALVWMAWPDAPAETTAPVAQQRPPAGEPPRSTAPRQTARPDTGRVRTAPAPRPEARPTGRPLPRPNARPAERRARPRSTERPVPSVQFAAAEEPEGTARVPAPGAEARRVLERARVVLLALAHADSTDDLSVLAPLAASVAADAAALVGDASPEGVLVGRLEPVLLTLAHLGPTDDPAATRMLRQQVDRHEFLLRLGLALVAAGPPIEDPE